MRRLLAVFLLIPFAAHAAGLTVFAAASMTNAMQDVGTLWAAKGHPKITFSFASSSTLALQIEHGAPAALFVSADEQWMDELARKNAIIPLSRTDLVGNSLVVVEPAARLARIDLTQSTPLLALLGPTGRLAIGDPAHVPAGIYARQSLTKLGLWDKLKPRLAPADSVRSALRLVETGEAPAGIVYATDAKITPTLGVAATFPPDTHDPILYPVALTKAGDTKEGRAFLAFLHSDQAQDVFIHYGFTKP
jgi:molybdate transport system substrate-binding protein